MNHAMTPRTRRRQRSHWIDILVASDPGFDRLRQASRAMLIVATSTLALFTVIRWSHEASTVAFVGIMVAMISSMAIVDPDPRQQKITTLVLPFVASAAVTMGAALAAWYWLSLLGLLVVVFADVDVRRFGPRATALGMIGFQSYFAAIFFHASLRQVPWMIAGICIATGVAYGVRFHVLPDRADRRLAQMRRAFRASLAVLLRHLAGSIAARRWTARAERRIKRDLIRLNDLALSVEDAALAPGSGAEEVGLSPATARMRIFEMELSAGRIAHIVWSLGVSEAMTLSSRRAAAKALLTVRAALGQGKEQGEAAGVNLGDLDCVELAAALRDLLDAQSGVAAEGEPETEAEVQAEVQAQAAPQPEKPVEPGLHLATRQAIQATVAAGLSAIAGQLISPQRWYWAVIAAYVIFARGTTRGETLTRASQRILGTLAGVLAGLALAHVLSGHRNTELALIFVCVFFSVYLIRVSYAWMAMWITTLLALLYSLMQQLTPGLLYLRLLQTLVGAGIGAIVALTVLPSRTRTQLRAVLGTLLCELGEVFDAIAVRPTSPALRPVLLERVRKLDRALQELRTSARPLTGPLVRIGAPGTSHLLHDVSGLVHYARHLARLSASGTIHGPSALALKSACATLTRAAREQASALTEQRALADKTRDELSTLIADMAAPPSGDAAAGRMVHWLGRIAQLLEELAERLDPKGASYAASRTAPPSLRGGGIDAPRSLSSVGKSS